MAWTDQGVAPMYKYYRALCNKYNVNRYGLYGESQLWVKHYKELKERENEQRRRQYEAKY